MGKINVDQAGLSDEFGNPLDALTKDIICQPEASSSDRSFGGFSESVIGNSDERIAESWSFAKTARAFFWRRPTSKRNGVETVAIVDGTNALCDASGNWDGSGPGSAAMPAARKNHIRADQSGLDLTSALFGSGLPNFRVPAPARPRSTAGPTEFLWAQGTVPIAWASVLRQ
jgi:hypothetical protein